MNRPFTRWLVLPLVLALLGLVSACGRTATEAPAPIDDPTDAEPEIQALASDVLVSTYPDRSAAAILDASVVSDEIYLFAAEQDVASVRFYLDDAGREGEPLIDERLAPFDFAGTEPDGSARAFDTRTLADGVHAVTAVITDAEGNERVSTSVFLVDNIPAGDAGDTLWLSRTPNRVNAEPLEGAEVGGDAYIYLIPSAPLQQIEFLVDGERVSLERYAFFDLATTAGDGSALPFDALALGAGEHRALARITRSDGSVSELAATFTVSAQAVDPADPAPEDPAPEDPAPQDPAPQDPAPQDPEPSEPQPEDPAPSDPAPTDPEPSDPAPEPISPPTAADPIRLSSNGRFLESASGKPFFMVADTMWGLMTLSRSQIDSYFKTRQEQGFNTILGPIVWGSGFRSPDGTDMSSPKMESSPYYDHLDYIVQKAKQYNLRLGLVMQWGDGNIANYQSAQNAYDYAYWIGSRYKNEPNIFWIASGEYNLGPQYMDYYDKIGQGLQAAVGSRQLVTIHPAGGEGYSGQSSSTEFHAKSWLDFNTIQTWTTDSSTFKRTLDDWAKSPAKPTWVSETKYEGSSVDAFRMRRNAYWSVFAGSLGFGYGHELVWKGNGGSWSSYLNAPGALDMNNLRKLVESRMYTPQGEAIFADHKPDQALIRKVDGGSNPEGSDSARGRVAGMSDRGGAYFMAYVPTNGSSRTVEVDLGKIRGGTARAWWYSPDSGAASEIGSFEASGSRSFTTPGSGQDWVLVVDDASLGWGAPGK